MRFYKLRLTPRAAQASSAFNEQFAPETVADNDSSARINWIFDEPEDTVLVCEKVLSIVYIKTTILISGRFLGWQILRRRASS